jgi:hypothetical protein
MSCGVTRSASPAVASAAPERTAASLSFIAATSAGRASGPIACKVRIAGSRAASERSMELSPRSKAISDGIAGLAAELIDSSVPKAADHS